MNKYSLVYEDEVGEQPWVVTLNQVDGKTVNEWVMCFCESKKDAEEIISALEFAQNMALMYERQEAFLKGIN